MSGLTPWCASKLTSADQPEFMVHGIANDGSLTD
jgi:hypothetical protein